LKVEICYLLDKLMLFVSLVLLKILIGIANRPTFNEYFVGPNLVKKIKEFLEIAIYIYIYI